MKRGADSPHSLLSRLQRSGAVEVVGSAGTFLHDACIRIGGDKALAAVADELAATLDLLDGLDADAEMSAACALHTLGQSGVCLPEAEAKRLPAGVRDLLDGQQAAEKVWSLYAARSSAGSAEGLRRLLLAIIRDLRVVLILLSRASSRACAPRSTRRPSSAASWPS